MPTPYDRIPADLTGVARGRRLITPADADLAIAPKAVEVVNKGATALMVAIRDSYGDTSTVDVLPNSKDYLPVLVTRVAATGTSASADLVIHGYFDAK